VNKTRVEKKKYNVNYAGTDLMDRYMEEYDNGGTNRERDRDRSVSPNASSNSLLQTDMKRHRESSSCSSSVGNNNHNQHSPDKLTKHIDEGTAIKTE
jgi:hypothetical protein